MIDGFEFGATVSVVVLLSYLCARIEESIRLLRLILIRLERNNGNEN